MARIFKPSYHVSPKHAVQSTPSLGGKNIALRAGGCPIPPPPSLVAVPGGGVWAGGALLAVPGGGGGDPNIYGSK